MKILIDAKAARRLTHVGTHSYDDLRFYYLAETDLCFLLVGRNGTDPLSSVGFVADAKVGREAGWPGFCHEHHIGQQMTKVTLYRLLPSERSHDATLTNIMAGAPRLAP